MTALPKAGALRPVASAPGQGARLGEILLHAGVIDHATLDTALAAQRRSLCRLGDLLIRRGHATEDQVYDALARQAGAARWRPDDMPPDAARIDRLGAAACARTGCVPLGPRGAVTPVATCNPAAFAAQRPRLERLLGPVSILVASRSQIDAALTTTRRQAMVRTAERAQPRHLSCRGLIRSNPWRRGLLLAAAAGLAAGSVLAPVAIFVALALLAGVLLMVNTALMLAGILAALRRAPGPDAATRPTVARLPRISILVPLFREPRIAGALVRRLSVLDYPAELLEICLVTEASDDVTRAALGAADLPVTMRVVTVPDGAVRTKPRAMNYALPFCTGDVVGIYDAEDAPPADQLRRIVDQFAASPPDVGCLQARLNFYNSDASWLARCFCLDYATWFGLMLPALARLGWPIPLGGTSVFFRRDVLDRAGAWDAHNVTEDADLGVRLSRFGYRVALLESTTLEEAPTRPRAWVRQRSRWQKGYALTWAVHMQGPRALLRDLGAWRFAGIQVLFLGSLGGAIMAPVLWSFWLLWLGLPHPLTGALSGAPLRWAMAVPFGSFLIQSLAYATVIRRERHARLWRALPLMPAYFALSTLSICKALTEVVTRPFYWDKTEHGLSPPSPPVTAPDRVPNRA